MICSYCQTPLPEHSRFCAVCGADLSDPELTTRQRTAVKELFEAVKEAVAGRYRVSDMLGRGGMGAVFLAEDLRLGRLVAIKILRPELARESASVARFQREVRIAALLDHPNIIPVYAVEEVGDFHYFVMKYMAGKSLHELLAETSLAIDQARRILWQAARGLGHAHQRGVIHRDIKPSNIMVDEEGQVVITDFGISKAVHASTQYTLTGQMIGTPQYLSPEQARDLPVDGRSDQYSLAVVGYQMLVGRPPLVGATVHALLYKHIYEVPTPASTVRPEIPADLSDALQRALSKAPEDRFPTMEEFGEAVWAERDTKEEPRTPTGEREAWRSRFAPPAPTVASPPQSGNRRRAIAIDLALLALAVVVMIIVTLKVRGREPPATGRQVETAAESDPRPEAPLTAGSDSSAALQTSPPASIPPAPDTAVPQPQASTPVAPLPPEPQVTPRVRKNPIRPPKPNTATPLPSPPAPRVGYVTINAAPYGTVSIDGVEVGDTPIVRHELLPGEHIIRITREGFRAESTTATITAGNEVRLSRSLVKSQ